MREQCALRLITGFKPAGYPYPSGRGYDLVLYLRNAGETKQAVLSDGQILG
jgi:hypothetical protein